MDIRNRRALKQEAAAALSAAPDQKKIITLYIGVSLLLSLVVTVVNHLLENMVADTSGLSNIGTRTILQTVQTVLPMAQLAVVTFWDYGYQATAMRIARRQSVEPRELTDGFHIWGPILRLTILQYMISFGLTFASIYLGSMVFVFSPFAAPLSEALAPHVTTTVPATEVLLADPAIVSAVMDSMLPMIGIILVICLLLAVPVMYLFRMSAYCLLDNPRAGALAALLESRKMMRRNRMHLLKLDLSFWWYHLLTLALTAICYGDVLLPLVGVALPFGETASTFLFYGIYMVACFAFTYVFRNQMEVTYVNAYEALKPKPQQGGVVLGNIFQM